MTRLVRVLLVGALSGAVLLTGIFLVLTLFTTTPRDWLTMDALAGPIMFGPTYGAFGGTVIALLLGTTFLRAVPVWIAVVWSMTAILLGLVTGFALGSTLLDRGVGLSTLAGAGIALLVSSLTLWWRYRPAQRADARR